LNPSAHNENDFPFRSRQEPAYQFDEILNSIGLSFQELLLHSQTMVVMQVHLVGQDLFVHAVSRAAHDFFVDAPFSIGGKRLRDLVCSALSRVCVPNFCVWMLFQCGGFDAGGMLGTASRGRR
jgi:hypothetical protein